MPWCPKCGYEYRPEIEECPDCNETLVDESQGVRLLGPAARVRLLVEALALGVLGIAASTMLHGLSAVAFSSATPGLSRAAEVVWAAAELLALLALPALLGYLYGLIRRREMRAFLFAGGWFAGYIATVALLQTFAVGKPVPWPTAALALGWIAAKTGAATAGAAFGAARARKSYSSPDIW